jgi:hypothetical protein
VETGGRMAERKRDDSKSPSGHSAVTGLSSRVTPAPIARSPAISPGRLASYLTYKPYRPGRLATACRRHTAHSSLLTNLTPPPPSTTSSLLNFLQRSSLSILPYREAPASDRPAFTNNITGFTSQFGGSLPVRNRSPPWFVGGLKKEGGGAPLSCLTAKSAGRCPVKV